MALLIRNGDIVTADSRYARRHLRRRRNHHPHRRRPRSAARRRSDRRRGQAGVSRLHRSARPHLSALHGDLRQGHARDRQHRGAGRRHHHLHRNVLPLPHRRRARRLPTVEIQGRRQQRLRLHLPHVGDQVRGPAPKASLREIVADGIASFKIFLAYKNFFGVDDGEMYQTLKLAREAGRDRHRALRERRAGRPPAAGAARARARPVPSGTSPAVRNRSRPKAPTASPRSSKTPAPPATWCISPASPR